MRSLENGSGNNDERTQRRNFNHIYDQARIEYDTIDIARRWPTTEFKMAASETGSGNNYCAKRWRHDFNGCTNICNQTGHVYDTLNIARRYWLVTGIQDGGH